MTDSLINLVIAIVGVAIAAITTYVIPFIREKITASKWDMLIYYTTLAVRYANQTIPPDQWMEKKLQVTEYLRDVIDTKLHINVNESDLDKIIEGIVNEVKESKAVIDKGC